MTTKELSGIRSLDSSDDFSETRLEAVGFIFHGVMPTNGEKVAGSRSNSNLLHFARCNKLEKVTEGETKIWFRSVRVALKHLDEKMGKTPWRWCKLCEREITQRIIDET